MSSCEGGGAPTPLRQVTVKALLKGLPGPSSLSSYKSGSGRGKLGGHPSQPMGRGQDWRGPGAGSRKQETAKPIEACSHLPHLPSLPLKSAVRTEGEGGPCSRPYLLSFLAGTKLIICKKTMSRDMSEWDKWCRGQSPQSFPSPSVQDQPCQEVTRPRVNQTQGMNPQ